MERSSTKLTKSRVMGLIGLIIFALAFIFACLVSVLPVGRIIVGTFGIITYPLMLIMCLICLAKFLGFHYNRRLKPTIYFLCALFSVLFVIHSITTYNMLSPVANANLLKLYLLYSYNGTITLLGGFGSVFTGIISMLLGGMGTLILFVILTTIFVGLLIDYEMYGKYEPHIKKLKSRKLREKVNSSDSDVTQENSPNYSFSNQNDDVFDEITVDANEVDGNVNSSENPVPIYTSEVVGEITDEDISNTNPNYSNIYTGYNTYQGTDDEQVKNEFSNNVYKPQNYPDVYSTDLNDYRRQFMSDTFGNYKNTSEPESPSEPVYPQNFNEESIPQENEQIFGTTEFPTEMPEPNAKDFGDMPVDDELSKILNSSEDSLSEVKNDVAENYQNDSFRFNFNEENTDNFETKNEESSNNINNTFEPQQPNISNTFEPQQTNIRNTYEPQQTGSGINNYNGAGPSNIFNNQTPVEQKPEIPSGPKFTVPSKTTKPNNFGFNVGMAGIRYNPPPLSLLAAPVEDTGDYTEEQNRKSAQLENVLEAFNIPAKVKNIVRGPKITRYELSVPLGVSVKKIPSYENDIAAALAAKTITIKAPIPGSSYVGIELENDTYTNVSERELLESDAFQNCKDPLPIAIGKDISGEIVVKSLAKLVHMLVAGSTGSGKSVFIHNIILSLIYKSSPDDLRLVLIDPKKVEFNMYNGLPHLLTPEVVSTSEKAISALKWSVKEMERRYELMSKAGFNNIEPYNKSELVRAGQFEKFPYIVIIVDELAELIMANKKEAEACIQRLTQLARACGMHLILATQRPSVDIISGVIKNNVPTRVAFSLQSAIDSKTILNTAGAEKLLSHGDMIFAPTGTSATPRLQGGWASSAEIKAVIDYDIKNNPASYDEAVINGINAEQQSPDNVGNGGGLESPFGRETVDNYFKTAVKIVMQNNAASVSYLQRRLSIGYSRAARIVDQMAEKGYVSEATGSKVRKVLITPEQFKADFGEDYDSID